MGTRQRGRRRGQAAMCARVRHTRTTRGAGGGGRAGGAGGAADASAAPEAVAAMSLKAARWGARERQRDGRLRHEHSCPPGAPGAAGTRATGWGTGRGPGGGDLGEGTWGRERLSLPASTSWPLSPAAVHHPTPTSTSSMQGEGLTPAQPQGRRVVGDGGGALGSMFLFLCARPPLPDAPPARRSARAPRQADHHLVVEEG